MATRMILVVEDEESIALPLAAALEREGYATRVTGSAPDAIALAAELQPDLMLLDVMLSDGSGLDVCREVRRPRRPIIMLTARGTRPTASSGSSWGRTTTSSSRSRRASWSRASGRCCAASRDARRTPAPAPPSAARGRRLRVDPPRGAALARRCRDRAHAQEFDLLAELVRNAGTVRHPRAADGRGLGHELVRSTKTLDVHVSSLRRKLGDDAGDAALPAHGARRGVPLRGGGRARGVTLRAGCCWRSPTCSCS